MRNLLPLILYLSSLALLLIGERMFGPGYAARMPLAFATATTMTLAVALRAMRWRAASGETKKVLNCRASGCRASCRKSFTIFYDFLPLFTIFNHFVRFVTIFCDF